MPRNGSGSFTLPAADFPAVATTLIESSKFNNVGNDISQALTDSISKNGETIPTADLPMGGKNHTNVADADLRNEYASLGQTQDQSFLWCGTAGGTANAITLSPTPGVPAYKAGQVFRFKSGASANTGAVTFAISGLAVIAGQVNFAACAGKEIAPNQVYEIWIDPGLTSCQIIGDWYGNWRLKSYTLASLPAAGYAGREAIVTDDNRGVWRDNGTQWLSRTAMVDARDFASLSDAVTYIGSSNKTLIVLSQLTVSTSITIPANVNFVFNGEGSILKSGSGKVRFNSPLTAPSNKVFYGFASFDIEIFGGDAAARPEWWGAAPTGIESGAAIQLAIDSLRSSGGVVDLQAGIYSCAVDLSVTVSGITIRGHGASWQDGTGPSNGYGATMINYTGTGFCLTIGNTSRSTFLNGVQLLEFGIIGNVNASGGIKVIHDTVNLYYVQRTHFSGVSCSEFTKTGAHGIYVEYISQSIFSRVICHNNYNGCYVADGTDMLVEKSIFRLNSGLFGLQFDGMSGLTINQQTLFESNNGPGLLINNVINDIAQVSIKNCRFENNNLVSGAYNYHLYVTGTTLIKVLNIAEHQFTSSNGDGDIYINYAQDCEVSSIQTDANSPKIILKIDANAVGVKYNNIDRSFTGLVDPDGRAVAFTKANGSINKVLSTASLPAAGAASDGLIIIEDVAAGDRNLIIYAGGQRFRIDGGAAF